MGGIKSHNRRHHHSIPRPFNPNPLTFSLLISGLVPSFSSSFADKTSFSPVALSSASPFIEGFWHLAIIHGFLTDICSLGKKDLSALLSSLSVMPSEGEELIHN